MATPKPRPTADAIERLVRQIVFEQIGKRTQTEAPQLVVNSSARHMHITQENLEILFGPGHELEVHRWLYQEGQFAAKETVTLIGPRRRIIEKLRILGPTRNLTQVELALTDAVQLGIEAPVRLSGKIEDTPGCLIMGPNGSIQMPHGVIRAARHVHMSPSDAAFYGVKHLDVMKLKVHSEACTTIFDDLLVRVDPSFKLEVHIDTDEANACNLEKASGVELIR